MACSDPEDKRQRIIDGAQFIGFESPCGSTEPLWVDDGCLFDKHASQRSVDSDRGAEARWPGARGGRRDQGGAESKELVGLHHYCVPFSALLVAARAPR